MKNLKEEIQRVMKKHKRVQSVMHYVNFESICKEHAKQSGNKASYIPKENGKLRPLGIPSYEDKLVQGVMRKILDAIYEPLFLDCSYGFWEGRNCHQAIFEINRKVMMNKVNNVVDAEIKGVFDNINHEWMIWFLEHEIQDKNFIRYIKRFLIAGIMENAKFIESDKGTPQGGLISTVLAKYIYIMF